MHKNLVTEEELLELLSDIHNDEESAVPKTRQTEERASDRAKITIQYLQQAVQQLQREMGELRERLDKFEGRQSGGGTSKAVAETLKAPAAPKHEFEPRKTPGTGLGAEPKQLVLMSRADKHRARRGKWF